MKEKEPADPLPRWVEKYLEDHPNDPAPPQKGTAAPPTQHPIITQSTNIQRPTRKPIIARGTGTQGPTQHLSITQGTNTQLPTNESAIAAQPTILNTDIDIAPPVTTKNDIKSTDIPQLTTPHPIATPPPGTRSNALSRRETGSPPAKHIEHSALQKTRVVQATQKNPSAVPSP